MARLADGDGHRADPGHRPEPRGRGHRDLPRPAGQADGPAGHPAGQRAAGRRRPGVRRRGHPRPGVRGAAAARCLTTRPDVTHAATRPDDRDGRPRATSPSRSPTRSRASCVAVTRGRRGRGARTTAISLLLLEVSQLLLAGGRLGAHRRRRARTSGSSPTPAPTPTSTRCASALAEPARADRRATPRSSTRTPTSPSSSPAGSPTTSPTSWPTCSTACSTTAPAARPRRCGGGSSPTCRTGAPTASRRCAPCTRSSPTSASTPPIDDSDPGRGPAARRDRPRGHRRAVLTRAPSRSRDRPT